MRLGLCDVCHRWHFKTEQHWQDKVCTLPARLGPLFDEVHVASVFPAAADRQDDLAAAEDEEKW